MKSVPIQDLKQSLSAYIAEAEAGEPILITRHGRPIARLTAADLPHCRVGSRLGQGALEPVIRGGLGGRALEILDQDRRDRLDDLV